MIPHGTFYHHTNIKVLILIMITSYKAVLNAQIHLDRYMTDFNRFWKNVTWHTLTLPLPDLVPADPLKVRIYGPGTETAWVNTPTQFCVDTTGTASNFCFTAFFNSFLPLSRHFQLISATITRHICPILSTMQFDSKRIFDSSRELMSVSGWV